MCAVPGQHRLQVELRQRFELRRRHRAHVDVQPDDDRRLGVGYAAKHRGAGVRRVVLPDRVELRDDHEPRAFDHDVPEQCNRGCRPAVRRDDRRIGSGGQQPGSADVPLHGAAERHVAGQRGRDVGHGSMEFAATGDVQRQRRRQRWRRRRLLDLLVEHRCRRPERVDRRPEQRQRGWFHQRAGAVQQLPGVRRDLCVGSERQRWLQRRDGSGEYVPSGQLRIRQRNESHVARACDRERLHEDGGEDRQRQQPRAVLHEPEPEPQRDGVQPLLHDVDRFGSGGRHPRSADVLAPVPHGEQRDRDQAELDASRRVIHADVSGQLPDQDSRDR